MEITLVGHTKFLPMEAERLTDGLWEARDYLDDVNEGGNLAEFAARGCYESWTRPNPATATLDGYLEHIFDVEHLSVIEHGTVSLHFSGVSRSFTHELIRHRHFSFSQLSQRYAKLGESQPGFVIPPLFEGEEEVQRLLFDAWRSAVGQYHTLMPIAVDMAQRRGYTGTMARKRAQEAARCVLPNMTPTKIVVSGNHRSWVDFLLKRGGAAADLEIREAAFRIYDLLHDLEPAIYRNIEYVNDTPDGYLKLRGDAE